MFPAVTAAQLKEMPLFAGLTDDKLEVIAGRSLHIGAHPGVHLAHEGQAGFEFFAIVSGDAEVRSGDETVAKLSAGDVFGEMALMSGGRRVADVVATSVMSLITMMSWDFSQTVQDFPVIESRLKELAEGYSS